MIQPKPSKKRVVSRSKYLTYLAKKMALRLGSVLLGIGGLCSISITILLMLFAYFLFSGSAFEAADGAAGSILLGIIFWGGVSSLLMLGAVVAGKKVKKIEPVLPPTRQNLEQLPAEETLLRASAEPPQTQATVLLRAAAGGEETPPEQLLRPDVAPTP